MQLHARRNARRRVPFFVLLLVPFVASVIIFFSGVLTSSSTTSQQQTPLAAQERPAPLVRQQASRDLLSESVKSTPAKEEAPRTAEPSNAVTQASPPPHAANFPYNLGTGSATLRAFISASKTPLPPCQESFATHQVAAGFFCTIKHEPGRGMFCYGERVVFDPSKVQMSRGGEDVGQVMGRSDAAEQANIIKGAFSFGPGQQRPCDRSSPAFDLASSTPWAPATLSSLCSEQQAPTKCSDDASFDGLLTIFVTRFEYVNIYHTATELAAAVSSLMRAQQSDLFKSKGHGARNDDDALASLSPTKVRLVFLDGHAKGSLDDLWTGVFGGVKFLRAGHMESSLCMGLVLFCEIGYSAFINIHPGDRRLNALSRNGRVDGACRYTAGAALAARVTAMTGSTGVERIPGKVVFVMRDHAKTPAHPRVIMGFLERAMSDEASLRDRVALMRARGLDVSLAYLSTMSFEDQVRLIRSCDAVITVHGAALTHLIWAHPETLFVELSPSAYGERMHFVKMSLVKGQHFARLGPGNDANFLGGGSGVSLSADMLESLVEWSLLSSDKDRLDVMHTSNFRLDEW